MKNHAEKCNCIYCQIDDALSGVDAETAKYIRERIAFMNEVNRATVDVVLRVSSGEPVSETELHNLSVYCVSLATNNNAVATVRDLVVMGKQPSNKILDVYAELIGRQMKKVTVNTAFGISNAGSNTIN